MLLNLLQQFDIALADFLSILFALGLGLFFVLAALCLPVAVLFGECVYLGTRKAFQDKCAMQTAQAAFASGLVSYLAIGLCVTALLSSLRPELFAPLLFTRTAAGFFLPFIPLCAMALYALSWSALKKTRVLHLFLGLTASVCCLALLFFGILILGNVQQPLLFDLLWDTPQPVLLGLVEDFLTIPHQWFMLAFLLLTGLASGFSLAQVWLFMRRAKADYGRDYYNFALRYCARGAVGFCLAATALGGFIFYRLYLLTPHEFRQPADVGILVVAYGLPLVCCMLWAFMAKSDTPLRHKGGAFFSCIFLLIALCAQLAALISTFPLV